ncbi:hypothetical protein BGZ81_010794 [Podila clonocystis]|nr:hypothetical protein BGZ81_010794 [Podila clonocystis]
MCEPIKLMADFKSFDPKKEKIISSIYEDAFGSFYSGELVSYRKFRMKHESHRQKPIKESTLIRARFEAIFKDIASYVL